jgi:hypothetical protein
MTTGWDDSSASGLAPAALAPQLVLQCGLLARLGEDAASLAIGT